MPEPLEACAEGDYAYGRAAGRILADESEAWSNIERLLGELRELVEIGDVVLEEEQEQELSGMLSQIEGLLV